jgi:hypothetical protein
MDSQGCASTSAVLTRLSCKREALQQDTTEQAEMWCYVHHSAAGFSYRGVLTHRNNPTPITPGSACIIPTHCLPHTSLPRIQYRYCPGALVRLTSSIPSSLSIKSQHSSNSMPPLEHTCLERNTKCPKHRGSCLSPHPSQAACPAACSTPPTARLTPVEHICLEHNTERPKYI